VSRFSPDHTVRRVMPQPANVRGALVFRRWPASRLTRLLRQTVIGRRQRLASLQRGLYRSDPDAPQTEAIGLILVVPGARRTAAGAVVFSFRYKADTRSFSSATRLVSHAVFDRFKTLIVVCPTAETNGVRLPHFLIGAFRCDSVEKSTRLHRYLQRRDHTDSFASTTASRLPTALWGLPSSGTIRWKTKDTLFTASRLFEEVIPTTPPELKVTTFDHPCIASSGTNFTTKPDESNEYFFHPPVKASPESRVSFFGCREIAVETNPSTSQETHDFFSNRASARVQSYNREFGTRTR